MKTLLAVLFALPVSASAGPSCVEMLGEQPLPAALLERHPDARSLTFVRTPFPDQDDWQYLLRLNVAFEDGRTEDAGYALYKVEDDKLETQFNYRPHFQECRLSYSVVNYLLEQNPSIVDYPAHLHDRNLSAFIVALLEEGSSEERLRKSTALHESEPGVQFTSYGALLAEFYALESRDSVLAFRKKWVRAFSKHTPAGRLRAGTGFNHLKEVRTTFGSTWTIFEPTTYWNVTRDPSFNAQNGIRMVFLDMRQNQQVELTPDGQIVKTPSMTPEDREARRAHAEKFLFGPPLDARKL